VPIESRIIEEIREPVLAALQGAPGPILIETGSSLPLANVAAGLFLEATRAGLPARVPASIGYRVDSSRALRGRPGSVLLVVTDAAADARLDDPAYRLVARYDALDPADRSRLTQFLAAVDGRLDRLSELQHDHPRDYAELQELKRRDVRVAVFLRTG
jgi:hypothetical protein